MSTHPATTDNSASEGPEAAEISTADMETYYSNMCRGLMTPEEVILDFGVNPNIGGKIVDEAIQVHSRIIMSLPSAVRLHQLLQTMLTKRQQAQQAAAAGGGPVAVPPPADR